jgi:serine/threonine-protein phosphatase 2A catalytic subunit
MSSSDAAASVVEAHNSPAEESKAEGTDAVVAAVDMDASADVSSPTLPAETLRQTDGPDAIHEDVEMDPGHAPPDQLFAGTPEDDTWVQLVQDLLGLFKSKNGGAAAASSGDSPDDANPPSHCNSELVDQLCADAVEVFRSEEPLLDIPIEDGQQLVVVGDVHGQFSDLICHILTQHPPGSLDRKFLFLGDYVDRGPNGVETIMLLFALKCAYPKNVFILRGNHEESQTSRFYGFLSEVRSKFNGDARVWARFNEVFIYLPLAALVAIPDGRRFLCVHGGLSPQLLRSGLDGIRSIGRTDYNSVSDNDESSIVDGLLWSDPTEEAPDFLPNERGCGARFGPLATKEFCESNDLQFICRAHQMTMEGYTWTHENKCLTVFSAPNYCGISNNLGAVMEVSSKLDLHFRQFKAVASEGRASNLASMLMNMAGGGMYF